MYVFYLSKIYMYTYMCLYSRLPAKTGPRGGRGGPGDIGMEASESECGPFSLKRR